MIRKQQTVKFSEGMNGHFLPIALLVMIFGFICFLFSSLLAIICLIAAFCLFTSISGIELDLDRKKFRVYRTLFMYKIGKVKSFSGESKFFLKLSSENSYNFGGNTSFSFFIPSGGFYNNGKSKSITYDLVIIDELGRATLIYDFQKYKPAKGILSELTENGFSTRNLIAEKLESNRQNRL